MYLLIQNGQIINADGNIKGDILCRNGRIEKIGQNITNDFLKLKIIDANGHYVFPGG